MKTNKFYFLLSISILLFACSGSDDTPEEQQPANLRLIGIEFDDGDNSTQDESLEYSYNDEGKLSKYIRNTENHIYKYSYIYENGKLMSIERDNGELTIFTYNNGKISTAANSYIGILIENFEYYYDDLNRLKTRKDIRPDGELNCIIECNYTGDNLLIDYKFYDCIDGTGPESFAYDDKRNPLYEAYPPEHSLAYATMPFNQTEVISVNFSYTISYTYNDSGLPIKRMIYANGDLITTDTFTYEEF